MAEEVVGLIQQDGFWLPDYDADDAPRLVPYMRKMAKDAVLAASLARRHRLCVQAGGHIGIWPLALAWMYEKVVTFEPQPKAFSALLLNTKNELRIEAHNAALMDQAGSPRMLPGADSGTWRIGAGHEEVRAVTIDSMNLSDCDAIYLDVEGSEAPALAGAIHTIERFRPILHLEILPRSREATQAMVKHLRYRFVRSVHKDSIYVPD